ncbi:MAG: GGDEF domain-containing protein, partial [Xanthobacteraceae bacterium]
MHIDLQTLSVVTVFVAGLLGALLVFAGLQNHSVRAPMWWGAAHIVNATGFALLASRGTAPDFLNVDFANALVLLGYGLTWTGARIFDGRPIRPLLVLLAPSTWLLLCRIPIFADSVATRAMVGSAMLALLTLLAAQEFWRGRAEPLMSRWPTIIVLLAHATILLVRVPALLLSSTFGGGLVLSTLSFTLLAFGTLLFTIVLAFLQLNMTKERTELKHKINSLVDPLSGVANRRAFLDRAAALLVRQETDHEPLAMLLFDLDHFKQINDRFGHALGDTVLQAFAGTASQTLGADVLFARIGGEEFASCLPVGDLDEAYA